MKKFIKKKKILSVVISVLCLTGILASCEKPNAPVDPSSTYLDGSQLRVDYREKWAGNYKQGSTKAIVGISPRSDSAITLQIANMSVNCEPEIDQNGEFQFVVRNFVGGEVVSADTVPAYFRYNALHILMQQEYVLDKLPYWIN